MSGPIRSCNSGTGPNRPNLSRVRGIAHTRRRHETVVVPSIGPRGQQRVSTLRKIVAAFEAEGIEFIEDGVRYRAKD